MLVKELERQLGVRLFERTTRAVALTDAGRLLQPYAERVVTELRQLGVALQGSTLASRSTLTIAATPVIATCLLPKVVAEFARKHPEVRIQVMDGSLDSVRQAVLEGHANMGMAIFCEACGWPSQRIGVQIPAHEHQPRREAAQHTCPEPNMEISGWPTHDCFADVKPDSGLD